MAPPRQYPPHTIHHTLYSYSYSWWTTRRVKTRRSKTQNTGQLDFFYQLQPATWKFYSRLLSMVKLGEYARFRLALHWKGLVVAYLGVFCPTISRVNWHNWSSQQRSFSCGNQITAGTTRIIFSAKWRENYEEVIYINNQSVRVEKFHSFCVFLYNFRYRFVNQENLFEIELIDCTFSTFYNLALRGLMCTVELEKFFCSLTTKIAIKNSGQTVTARMQMQFCPNLQ